LKPVCLIPALFTRTSIRPPFEHPVDHPSHVSFVGEITDMPLGIPQFLGAFVDLFGGRGDCQGSSLAREEPGGRETYAQGATRPGHERDPTIEPTHRWR
jgi:hypothetical protein